VDLSDSIEHSHSELSKSRKSLVVGSSQSERDLLRNADLFKMEQKLKAVRKYCLTINL
jgi:hypothetical protein